MCGCSFCRMEYCCWWGCWPAGACCGLLLLTAVLPQAEPPTASPPAAPAPATAAAGGWDTGVRSRPEQFRSSMPVPLLGNAPAPPPTSAGAAPTPRMEKAPLVSSGLWPAPGSATCTEGMNKPPNRERVLYAQA